MQPWRLASFFCSAALAAGAPAQDLIGVSWSGAVHRVDGYTGASTVIGTGLFGQNALCRDDAGTLWATHRTASNTYALTSIDPATGAATIVHGNFPDTRGLANAGGGALFAILDGGPDSLALVDPQSGVVTPIGPTGFTAVQALTTRYGQLFAWDINWGLLTIDPATGLATVVNPSAGTGGVNVQWLAVRGDGRLIGGGGDLAEIDPLLGTATVIGSNGLDLRGAEPFGDHVHTFGTGCSGTAGQVTSDVLFQGASVQFRSFQHAANAPGAVFFGLSDTVSAGLPLPLDLDPLLGTQGCSLYVSLDVSVLALTGPTFPAALTLTLPVLPSWPGNALFAQHAVLENVPGGISLSDAVVVQFGY